MPRLLDLLQFLATPGLEDTWLLLDIKVWFHILHPLIESQQYFYSTARQ